MKTKKTNPKKPTATPAKTKRAAAKSARGKGNAKRTETPPPKPETPAARVLAAIAEVEKRNGNPPPPTSLPVDLSVISAATYSGPFLFAARAVLEAHGFDSAAAAAERSFKEVAAGRLRPSEEVEAAANALDSFCGRFQTPQGWRNAAGFAESDELAVRWDELRWRLLEAVAAFYQDCAKAERGGVDRTTMLRAVQCVHPVRRAIETKGTVSPLLEPLRDSEEINLTDFLSPDWVRCGELVGLASLSADAWQVLCAFRYVEEELLEIRKRFRKEIDTVEIDVASPASPSNAAATDAENRAARAALKRAKRDAVAWWRAKEWERAHGENDHERWALFCDWVPTSKWKAELTTRGECIIGFEDFVKIWNAERRTPTI